MLTAFYVAGAVSVLATLLAITRSNAVHALLYLAVSLIGVAVVFYTMGAPFVAALEVIIYAGAIMVLFIFVVMMLNLGEPASARERQWLRPRDWTGPSILAAILIVEVILLLMRVPGPSPGGRMVEPKEVGLMLLRPYLIGVELASLLLLAGLVGAYHLGRRGRESTELQYDVPSDVRSNESGVAAGRDLVRPGAGRASGAP